MIEELNRRWSRVREKFLYPELPFPIFESIDVSNIDTKNHQISLNLEFVLRAGKIIGAGRAMEALLDHEVGHFVFCPWDMSTHLTLYARAKRTLGKTDSRDDVLKLLDLFLDIVANTHVVKEKRTGIPDLYRGIKKEGLNSLVCALYEDLWGVDLNVDSTACYPKDLLDGLKEIPYLDRDIWPRSLSRFIVLMEKYLKDDYSLGSGHSFDRYSDEEVELGLSEFALEANSPMEFEEILNDVASDLKEGSKTDREGPMCLQGVGRGVERDASPIYYMMLAENFSLPIMRKPLRKDGSLFPYSHAYWEASMPLSEIDIWNSFGKILPGMTQRWIYQEGETFVEDEKVPDCLIMLDSSASMINPETELSYAVLGAGCAADAYLLNNASVSVYNFSDSKVGGYLAQRHIRNRLELYRTLCRYLGGGTSIDLDSVESLRKKSEKSDLLLVTDMKIADFEEVVEYLVSLKEDVTVIYMEDNPQVEQLIEVADGVSIFKVAKKEDVPKVVLGRMRERFHSIG